MLMNQNVKLVTKSFSGLFGLHFFRYVVLVSEKGAFLIKLSFRQFSVEMNVDKNLSTFQKVNRNYISTLKLFLIVA